MRIMKALILSAGVGERMRPVTDYLPKPLLPVIDRLLIEFQIARLAKQGIDHFGVNLFHHAPMIRRELAAAENAELVVEDRLLGTGGALGNFKHWSGGVFYVQACDMITDLPVDRLDESHRAVKPVATIALIKTGTRTDNIEVGGDNALIRVHDRPARDRFTYAGAAIYSPEIFSFLPERRIFSVVDLWHNALRRGAKIHARIIECQWYNINTPGSYLDLIGKALNNEIMITDRKYENSRYIHESSRVGAAIKGFASIGANCVIEETVTLENVVVLENTRLKKGEFRDSIVSDRFQCSCRR